MSKIPTIAMIPSAYKANKVYSVLPTNGDADLDFARTSTRTRVNKIGLIEDLATGVPALDYSDSGCPVLLVEPQSTNLITYSEDFSNAIWTVSAGGTAISPVVTTNQGLSPKGDNTADRVVFDLSGGSSSSDLSMLSETVTVSSGATTTKSIYLKSNTLEDYDLVIYDGVTGDAISVTVTQEWQRFSLTNSVPSTSSSIVFGLRNAFGVTTSDTADILIWGAQVEEQSYATSYIPTSGATATRVAETLSKTGLSNYIGQAEGAIFMELKRLDEQGGNVFAFNLTNSTNSERIFFQFDTTSLDFRVGLITPSDTNVILAPSSLNASYNKVAIAYELNRLVLFINGVKITEDNLVTTPTNIDTIKSAGFGVTFYGKVKDLRVYNQALTDTELQNLTS
jgi:hypothetical protein